MPDTAISRGLAWTMLLICASYLAYAQKAEPLRIEFRRGASSATVTGTLKGRQQMEYVIGARAGQTMSLRLTGSHAQTLVIKVTNQDGTEIPLSPAGRLRWTAPLRTAGDYGIDILRTNQRAPASQFTLTVGIR